MFESHGEMSHMRISRLAKRTNIVDLEEGAELIRFC